MSRAEALGGRHGLWLPITFIVTLGVPLSVCGGKTARPLVG
jgi:hypothetical protein